MTSQRYGSASDDTAAAATEQSYKLSFYYESDDKHGPTDPRDLENNYDGLVVQSYNDHVEGRQAARYARDFKEHGTGCILSAFLYFITISLFLHLAVLWVKQRMHMHVEQLQWW